MVGGKERDKYDDSMGMEMSRHTVVHDVLALFFYLALLDQVQ